MECLSKPGPFYIRVRKNHSGTQESISHFIALNSRMVGDWKLTAWIGKNAR